MAKHANFLMESNSRIEEAFFEKSKMAAAIVLKIDSMLQLPN
jgi:hypothetical protein